MLELISYLWCMVSLKLCKEYLNMATFKNIALTADNELNIFKYGTPSYVIITRVTNF